MRALELSIAIACVACDSSKGVLIEPPVIESAAPVPGRITRVEAVNPRLLRRFKPLRDDFGERGSAEDAEVALGRMLFFDPRLSKDGDVSCNSCHDLATHGVDHTSTSIGTDGKHGRRNAPSVYNAAGEIASFWDGRAANVEQQAKGPLLDVDEMAATPAEIVRKLTAIPGYLRAFHAAFPDHAAITFDDVVDAIGAFERGLVTPSRWDRYLAGDLQALSPGEVAGLRVFTDAGCITCHTGELVGGSMFQKAGVAAPWPSQRDHGRMELTNRAADDMVFKVPSLRNVANTAPYFHDGSVATLPQAVRMMGRYQIGIELSDSDIAAIVTWLGSLSGEPPASYIARPQLPR